MSDARKRLRDVLSATGPLVVGFSGGADSALLAYAATRQLGARKVLSATAVSPSLAASELEDCRELARQWGLSWQAVETDELSNPAYRENDAERCYHCKAELMSVLVPLAESRAATVALGVNLDDLGDYRPGQRAASERGAVFPLVEAGLTKSEVRELSKELGLRTADKPAAACLASRIPYGTAVSLGVLGAVERAESGLKSLGFAELRVRHYGDLARIEVPLCDLDRLLALREEVSSVVRAAGYRYVTVDWDGLRSGNLNGSLPIGSAH